MTREKTSSRRRGFLALTTILAATAAVVLVMPAFALDTSVFELDGNAVTDHGGAGIPDDWDRVCHQVAPSACPTASNTAAAVSVEWLAQGASTGTTFTGGGSKDPLAIEGWAWNQASGGLPGKDVLLNGFAARYTTAANNTICPGSVAAGRCSQIFFGMDRFDNSGDAQNGFWFFQNAISTTGGVPSGGGTTFTCTVPGDGTASPCHKLGDILVVSDFSIGGTISTITVYEWDPACTKAGVVVSEGTCADSNLAQISPTVTTAKCTPTAPGVPFCGIVNPVDGTTSPWPFADKKGSVNTFAQGEFYEGGIDLSNFPGLANECFASTLAESRASTSTSAVLKSFLLGNFGGCTTTVTTQSTPATSESIGGGSASTSDIASVTVTGAAAWTGTLQFYLCGPSASSCSSATGLAIGSGITVNQNTAQPISSAGATVTSVGSYCWAARFTSSTSGVPNGNDNGAHECFTVIPVTPTLRTAAGPGPVLLGNPVTDTATLAGTANQPGSPVINGPVGAAAGGSITFTLFGPTSCSTLATGTGINPQTVSVSGDNTYGPVSFTPNQVGTYHWVASYSGNSPNTLSTSHNTACTGRAKRDSSNHDVRILGFRQRYRERRVERRTQCDGNGRLLHLRPDPARHKRPLLDWRRIGPCVSLDSSGNHAALIDGYVRFGDGQQDRHLVLPRHLHT